jgi:hypothetical protein
MKLLHVALLVVASLSYASDDGNFASFSPVNPAGDPGTDDIAITVIESWVPGVQILGLDWLNDEDGFIAMASATDDMINRWDASSEALSGAIDLMDTNTNCFGVAAGPTGALFTSNDWSLTNLFVRASTWIDLPPNPAGSGGRGMEFDEETGEYWEAGSDGSTHTLYRFIPGVGSIPYVITEPTYRLSGIAVFPYDDNLGVVVTTYNVHNFYFYEFDGTTLTHLGTVPCPALGQSSSLGLCYANSRDTFFWSWSDGSTYHLTELDIDFNVSLTPSTWGSIKTLF